MVSMPKPLKRKKYSSSLETMAIRNLKVGSEFVSLKSDVYLRRIAMYWSAKIETHRFKMLSTKRNSPEMREAVLVKIISRVEDEQQ